MFLMPPSPGLAQNMLSCVAEDKIAESDSRHDAWFKQLEQNSRVIQDHATSSNSNNVLRFSAVYSMLFCTYSAKLGLTIFYCMLFYTIFYSVYNQESGNSLVDWWTILQSWASPESF